jgi:hypothetical protein
MKYNRETEEIWSYVRQQVHDHNSPIIQMFMRPCGKPWVIISDFRESQDIQQSRTGEFDRSAFVADIFQPLLPGNHVWVSRL